MIDQETVRDGHATALAPHTGGVPLLALVLSGALRLRDHGGEADDTE